MCCIVFVLLTLKLYKMFELIKNNRELDNIESLFNQFFNDTFLLNNKGVKYVDSYFSDDDNNYYMELALPGLEKKDINLSVDHQDLYIDYQSKGNKNNSIWNKSFDRKIKLPSNADINSVGAKLKNGILSITIKKHKDTTHTKIDIK